MLRKQQPRGRYQVYYGGFGLRAPGIQDHGGSLVRGPLPILLEPQGHYTLSKNQRLPGRPPALRQAWEQPKQSLIPEKWGACRSSSQVTGQVPQDKYLPLWPQFLGVSRLAVLPGDWWSKCTFSAGKACIRGLSPQKIIQNSDQYMVTGRHEQQPAGATNRNRFRKFQCQNCQVRLKHSCLPCSKR